MFVLSTTNILQLHCNYILIALSDKMCGCEECVCLSGESYQVLLLHSQFSDHNSILVIIKQ